MDRHVTVSSSFHLNAGLGGDQPGWMSRFIDYFVVCGLGTEVKTVDGEAGFLGVSRKDGDPIYYVPDLNPLDFYPQKEHKKFCVPEGLSMVRYRWYSLSVTLLSSWVLPWINYLGYSSCIFKPP